MRLHYYGTGASEGIPALFCACDLCRHAREQGGKDVRTRSGAIVDSALKLDFPPDTYMHILTQGLDMTDIEHLLITHPHHDHFAFADLEYRRPGFAMLREDAKPLTVYGNAAVVEKIEELLGDHYGDAHDRLRAKRIVPYEPVEIGGYRVTGLTARHMNTDDCLMYLIEKDGKSLLYAHDTGLFPEETTEYLAHRSIDVISLDCTYMAGETDGYNGHMGLPADRRMRERLTANGAADAHTRFVVNHFSHNGHLTHEALCEAAQGFIVSYDGLTLDI